MSEQIMEFNHIYIIQSLSSGEEPTGEQLAARLQDVVSQNEPDVQVDFLEVETKKDLLDRLRDIGEAVERDRWPIVHLEIHGNPNGMILNSGEPVGWEELAPALTEINTAVQNNLLVTLAVCSGAHFGKVLLPSRPAPMWGLIGPDQQEWNGVLFEGYTEFYRTLLTTLDGDAALANLQDTVERYRGDAQHVLITADRLFAQAFQKYVAEQCNDTAAAARARKLVAQLSPRYTHTIARRQRLRALGRAFMKNPRAAFERFRRTHFMIDKFPQNEERFPLTYDDVMKQS